MTGAHLAADRGRPRRSIFGWSAPVQSSALWTGSTPLDGRR